RLAARAYRGAMPDGEPQQLRAFYRHLRDQQLSHDAAVRDTLVSILMSPYFCYRWEPVPVGRQLVPVADVALANRLSYFLWSSMPDDTLLELARKGKLQSPETLSEQLQRMRIDPRVRGMVTEFAGNWLDFRRFQQHNAVDRQRYPQFDAELRAAMFAEPIHFIEDLVRRDGSILELVDGNHTFVNAALARHYRVREPTQGWSRIETDDANELGGLLPMAVFQTMNSPGLRTSPVKRGYWVVRRLLGETIPPPPPNVPELPKDEAATGDRSLPELLAAHRAHASCAACHERFDSFGLAFEGLDPIGQQRTLDGGGRAIVTDAVYPDGVVRRGVAGLRDYLRDQRRDDFVDNVVRKCFAFALGRNLLLSDEVSVQTAKQRLAAGDYRFSVLLESIVLSPQFRQQRTLDYVPDTPELSTE
ncbi:MAG: DUF1592 domain-containing protein, partial [Planctomycetales bacterium]|nr:DUF1592 domain-containing protein [Planctomycetales bacterium]